MSSIPFTAQTGREQFLHLLVTQLQHQDPLEPVGQQDFLQQLAQFSTVEGIEKLNANFDQMLRLQHLTQGIGLTGQVVRFHDNLSDQELVGRVEEVRVENGQFRLIIGEYDVSLDDVKGVIADQLYPIP